MRPRSRSALVLSLWVAGIAVCVWSLMTTLTSVAVLGLTYTSLGAFLVLRRPGERFGWLMFGYGLGSAATFFTPGEDFWVVAGPWVYGGGATLLLFFPDGRLPSTRWKPMLWVAAALWVGAGLDERFVGFAAGAGALVATGPIWRYRTADWLTRTQLKWLAWVVGVGVIGLLSIGAAGELVGWGSGPALVAMAVTILTAVVGVPVAMVVAVLSYRLYEIDRLVSRTVSYGLVVGLLAVVFAAGVVWIPSALDLGDSQLLVAASTLVVAAMFNPLRRRVRRVVDRRFNRSRYDAERVMERFAASLRNQIDPNGVVDGWVEVVSETMQPASVAVWVRE